jgi:hypothetical protein
MRALSLPHILIMTALIAACGEEKPDPQPAAKAEAVQQPALPPPEPQPFDGCQQGLTTSGGLEINCVEFGLVVGDPKPMQSATALLAALDEVMRVERPVYTSKVGELVDGHDQWPLLRYSWQQDGQPTFALTLALETSGGQGRVVHCLHQHDGAGKRCERAMVEIARKGDVPAMLRPPRNPAKLLEEAAPRAAGEPIVLTAGCAVKAKGMVQCEDGAALMWQELVPQDPAGREAELTDNMRAGMKQREPDMKIKKLKCRVRGASTSCEAWQLKQPEPGSVWLGHAEVAGTRLWAACAWPKRLGAQPPKVCQQLIR